MNFGIDRQLQVYIKDFYRVLNMKNKIDISKELHERKILSDEDYDKYLILLGKQLDILTNREATWLYCQLFF